MKGGILSAINEWNLIIVWVCIVGMLWPDISDPKMQRLCQSSSPVEAQELLEGLKQRCIKLDVPKSEMAVVDNCCMVCNQINNVMLDLKVVLNVYHFIVR
jgi:hypothetical protein